MVLIEDVLSLYHDLLMFSSADIVGSPVTVCGQGCDIGVIQDSESEGARQTLGPSYRF